MGQGSLVIDAVNVEREEAEVKQVCESDESNTHSPVQFDRADSLRMPDPVYNQPRPQTDSVFVPYNNNQKVTNNGVLNNIFADSANDHNGKININQVVRGEKNLNDNLNEIDEEDLDQELDDIMNESDKTQIDNKLSDITEVNSKRDKNDVKAFLQTMSSKENDGNQLNQ